MKLHCWVNGEEITVDVEPRLLPSDFIRHELQPHRYECRVRDGRLRRLHGRC